MKKALLPKTNKQTPPLVTAVATLTAGFVSLSTAAFAMDTEAPSNLHAEITREALSATLSPENLQALIDANNSQDAAGTDGVAEKRRHFDVGAMNAAVQYINREKTKALNSAAEADVEPQSRADALRHLGLMLHTVQDFYTHSNYVDMQLERAENKADPYNIPLVDWTKVPGGYASPSGARLTAAKYGDSEDPLNKDSDTVGGGKVLLSERITYHAVARELALRETQRQWNLFETLVGSRCGDRSAAVVAALRRAAPQASASKDIESNQTILGDPQGSPDSIDSPDPKDMQ